jgi:hypothetical protein
LEKQVHAGGMGKNGCGSLCLANGHWISGLLRIVRKDSDYYLDRL